MRNDVQLLGTALLTLLLSLPANAAEVSKLTVGSLSDVQAQAVMAEAKVRLQTALDRLPAEMKGGATAAPTSSSSKALRDAPLPEPVVRTIYGSGGRMTATFLFPGGVEADAGAGQDLPGGYRVESISMDKVMLSKDGRRFPVGFSSVAPSAPAQMIQGGAVAPALPGGMLMAPSQNPPTY